MGEKKFIKEYLSAFLLPIILLMIILYSVGIEIWDKNSILTNDLWAQYVSFFAYFKSVFKSGGSLFYGFYKTLGGEMVGITAYYLLSPFNFVLLFFPNKFLPAGIFLITIFKIGMCGLSFEIFCQKIFGNTKYTVLFSVMYALMGYNMVYMSHIMWLDGVMILPIIAWGIDSIIDKKSPGIYFISLVYGIITNYYIGFMLCIFSVIYFAYRSGMKYKNMKTLRANCLQFIVSSLLAGGSTAVLLLPTLHALEGTKANFTGLNLQLVSNFHFMDIFSKFYTNTFSWQEFSFGMPNIYSGILVLFLLILYFLNENIQLRIKIWTGAMLLVFLLSFYVRPVNLLWHGMNTPNWFPYRYSFIFTFLVLTVTYESFIVLLKKMEKRKVWIAFLIFFLLTMVLYIQGYEYWQEKYIIFDIMIVGTVTAVCLFSRNKRLIGGIVMLICISDLSLNGIRTLEYMSYKSNQQYREEFEQTDSLVNAAKQKFGTEEFYRMEKNYKYIYNEDMIFDYNGFTHYSSAIKEDVRKMAEKMGYRVNAVQISYDQGNTVFSNSLFGIKGIISDKELDKPYIKVGEEKGKYIYENPYALSLAFGGNDNLLDKKDSLKEGSNPFEYQNKIFELLAEDDKLLEPALFEKINIINGEKIGTNKNHIVRVDENKPMIIEYEFGKTEVDNTYMWIRSNMNVSGVYANKQLMEFGDEYHGVFYNYVRPLIELKNEKVKTIRIETYQDRVNLGSILFYKENIEKLDRYFSNMEDNRYHIDMKKKTEVQVFNMEEKKLNTKWNEILYITLPYSKDWEVYVDKTRVEAQQTVNGLLGVKIPDGEHDVILKYKSVNVKLGMGISMISMMGMAFYLNGLKRKSRNME